MRVAECPQRELQRSAKKRPLCTSAAVAPLRGQEPPTPLAPAPRGGGVVGTSRRTTGLRLARHTPHPQERPKVRDRPTAFFSTKKKKSSPAKEACNIQASLSRRAALRHLSHAAPRARALRTPRPAREVGPCTKRGWVEQRRSRGAPAAAAARPREAAAASRRASCRRPAGLRASARGGVTALLTERAGSRTGGGWGGRWAARASLSRAAGPPARRTTA